MTIKVTRPQIDLREEINKALTTQTLENQDATVKSLVAKGGLTAGGAAKASQYLLEAISHNKTDLSAVDVFVYDTSKDSDGGAWRKRTQNTSWYNETLNTSTRGSRKDFPAVAVIVLSANAITIYDGDDPEMPMWMIFWRYENGASSGNTTNWNGGGGALTSISALNGHIVLGGYSGGRGFYLIKDKFAVYYTAAGGLYTQPGGLSRRNELYVAWGTADSDYKQINNQSINDVAMTVLPNSPIDADTGLPVPTFALATNGGVNVIHSDGSVISITNTQDSSTFNFCQDVQFRSDGGIVWSADSTGNSSAPRFVHVLHVIPTSNFVHTTVANPSNTDEFYARTTTSADAQFISASGLQALQESAGTTNVGTTDGLSSFAYNKADAAKGLTNHINTDYNTGWMHGDIKLATLSDTDTTNAGAEIVTNGDFATNSDWTLGAGWSIAGGKATHDSTTGNRYLTQGGILEEGKQYVLVFTISDYTSGTLRIYGGTTQPIDITEGVATYTIPFIAASGGDVNFQSSVSAAFVGSISNVSCKLAEQDRSVNGNGLQVLGTVTKTPVATGADLVGYSGFSTSNGLVQPYNSSLDPGTGDYCFIVWFKTDATSTEQTIMRRFGNPTVTGGTLMRITGSTSLLSWYTRDTSGTAAVANSPDAMDDGIWHMAVGVRDGNLNRARLYIDGNEVADVSTSGNSHDPGNTASLHLGVENTTTVGTFANPCNDTEIALARYSLTAPTAEQIKKMYEDEKFLFQENAKATLYGTSDAVTALAYDDVTDLLHVGTSAGRSDFQGLRRIDNTTDAISVAISVSNEMVAED